MSNKYKELILYLRATIALVEGLDKPDTKEDDKNFQIAVLHDMKDSLDRLISKLS